MATLTKKKHIKAILKLIYQEVRIIEKLAEMELAPTKKDKKKLLIFQEIVDILEPTPVEDTDVRIKRD